MKESSADKLIVVMDSCFDDGRTVQTVNVLDAASGEKALAFFEARHGKFQENYFLDDNAEIAEQLAQYAVLPLDPETSRYPVTIDRVQAFRASSVIEF